jgi:hypothetical protein
MAGISTVNCMQLRLDLPLLANWRLICVQERDVQEGEGQEEWGMAGWGQHSDRHAPALGGASGLYAATLGAAIAEGLKACMCAGDMGGWREGVGHGGWGQHDRRPMQLHLELPLLSRCSAQRLADA